MEQAIATTSETLPATIGHFDTGLEELSANDLIIPRLTITQPTSGESEENVGKFCINVTGDFPETLNVAVIKLSKSRILFPEKFKRDNEPLCRSHNFATPANDIVGATPMADSCGLIPGEKKKHVCSYANWTANEPPRCQEVWNLLVVDMDTYMPMWFSLKSTALSPLRKIISAISMLCNAKKVPMWRFSFTMSLNKTTNDSGTFYLPVFTSPSLLSADEGAVMDEIRSQLVGVDVRDAVEPVTQDAPPVSEDDDSF